MLAGHASLDPPYGCEAASGLAPAPRRGTGSRTPSFLGQANRSYDPEIGRFLSADPFVQELANLQSWNRYSYVLNNPLSYTDPSGFFFAKLFRSIGAAFSGLFKAIGSAFKALLKSPIFRAIVQIVACFNPVSCVAAAGAMTLATGGSIMDALKAMVISFAQIGISSAISSSMAWLQKAYSFAGTLVKSAVHGAISGAIAVAQGGNFLQGFAGGAIGVLGGALGTDVFGTGDAGMAGRTAFAAAAGCLGALVTGGKCAQAAVTAAISHLYNRESLLKKGVEVVAKTTVRTIPIGAILASLTEIVGMVTEALQQEQRRLYITYELRDRIDGERVYIGRTSCTGCETIEDVARAVYGRFGNHHAVRDNFTFVTIDSVSSSYFAIRGREQQLIDYYGGVGSDTVANTIRGVAYDNPAGGAYHRQSNRYFGMLHRYTGNPRHFIGD
ncbi:MAG: RHS repeat-associated core domain-containing protein [Hyphomicrobiaceae bacterium]